MKYLLITIIAFTTFSFTATSCNKEDKLKTNTENDNNTLTDKMKITIGSATFTATLFENETASAFKALLPMTINMNELNGNEKYFDLSNGLPANDSNPGTINSGDLMLYGTKTLVLFYEGFSTSYNYTKLGKIENTSGLVSALGSGNVSVTFELE